MTHRSWQDFVRPRTPRWPVWLAAVVVGGVFFFVSHDPRISRYESFAPWSEEGDVQAAGGNLVKGAALGLLGLLGAWFLVRRPGASLRPHGALPGVMLFYLAWAVASVAWSISPGASLRSLAVLGFCFLAALGIARQFQPRQLAVLALATTGAYLAVGLGAEMALRTFRPWSGEYRFAGTVHPNTQAAQTAIFCLSALALAGAAQGRRRAGLIAALAVGLVLLLLTRSRTGLAGFLVGAAALWITTAPAKTRLLTVLAGTTLVGLALLSGSLLGIDVENQALRVVMLGRQDESAALTGRVPIWQELVEYARERPLSGYGYSAFWTPEHIEDLSAALHWRFREAHCGYLDEVLALGLIGTSALVLGALLSAARAAAAYHRTRDPGPGLTLALVLFALVSSVLESGMIAPNFITLLVGCGAVQLAFLPPAPAQEPPLRAMP